MSVKTPFQRPAKPMRDPFRPSTNRQLVREAQFGFSVIGLLIAVLIYVAYYRLNDAGDPPNVENSPVAMQVFPNSPNYDRDLNLMKKRTSPGRLDNQFKAPDRNVSTLVSVPKRMMDDSQSTFRSLSSAATSIEKSAAKVSSLASIPVSKDPVELVSNPAAESGPSSGFKINRKPGADVATKMLPPPIKKIANRKTPEFENPARARFNQLVPKIAPTFGQPASNPAPNSTPKFDLKSSKPANDFKPLGVPTTTAPNPLKASPTKPSSFQPSTFKPSTFKPSTFLPKNVEPKKDESTQSPKTTSVDVPPRLPQLPQSSLSKLRPTPDAKTSPLQPKPESASTAVTKSLPVVKQVAFEQTTWTVKKGDSYWSIAQAHYGDGRFFSALYEQNRGDVPGFENLIEGTELILPTTEALCQAYPHLCPADVVHKDNPWRNMSDEMMDKITDNCESDLDKRFYETRAGDTLFGIARQQLGQASRYVDLMKLNEFRLESNMTHETELSPGIKLLLPIK